MFTVVRYGFVADTYPEIAANKTTLEEAKMYVENSIATYRRDMSKKYFFTFVILDMRIGKLMNSVEEAPPPVKWTGEQDVLITSERTIRPNLIADSSEETD